MKLQESNETSIKRRRVWFPESETGEPSDLNPDDGYGGGLFKLETVHPIYYSPTGSDHDILEGKDAREFAKVAILGKDWQRTMDLVYREFSIPIELGGCGGQWELLEDKLLLLEEPYWALIGELRVRVEHIEDDGCAEGAADCTCECPPEVHDPHRKCMCPEYVEEGDLNDDIEAASGCTCKCPLEADTHNHDCLCECAECADNDSVEHNHEEAMGGCSCKCPLQAHMHDPQCSCECAECLDQDSSPESVLEGASHH